MKIAFIGQKGIPAIAGEREKYVEKLSAMLAEMGHEVFVYARNNYTEKKLSEYQGARLIHIPILPLEKLSAAGYIFLATVHALFQKYDIIHYQGIGPTFLSFLPKILKRKSAIISTFHRQNYLNKKWEYPAKKILELAERIAYRIPHKSIVISKAIRSYIFNKYKTRTVYIPSGAQTEYNPDTKALDHWNLKEKRYILADAKLSGSREIKNFIQIFKKLEDTNKIPNNFKLVIIGNRFLKEPRESVIFTENQTGASLEQLFSHAYLFVQPSEPKEFSTALLESMSCGVVPLISNTAENLEIIGKCGFSFNGKSQQDLKEKLAYLLNKPSEVEKLGKDAKERARKEYSWNSIARKILKIYEVNQKTSAGLGLRKIQAENKYYVS